MPFEEENIVSFSSSGGKRPGGELGSGTVSWSLPPLPDRQLVGDPGAWDWPPLSNQVLALPPCPPAVLRRSLLGGEVTQELQRGSLFPVEVFSFWGEGFWRVFPVLFFTLFPE